MILDYINLVFILGMKDANVFRLIGRGKHPFIVGSAFGRISGLADKFYENRVMSFGLLLHHFVAGGVGRGGHLEVVDACRVRGQRDTVALQLDGQLEETISCHSSISEF